MDPLLCLGDHVSVISVDMLRNWTWTPAWYDHVTTILRRGPGDRNQGMVNTLIWLVPLNVYKCWNASRSQDIFRDNNNVHHWPGIMVARVSCAPHHQIIVSGVSPAIPQLRMPGHTPGPLDATVEITVHHLVSVNDIIISWWHWQQSTARGIQGSDQIWHILCYLSFSLKYYFTCRVRTVCGMTCPLASNNSWVVSWGQLISDLLRFSVVRS